MTMNMAHHALAQSLNVLLESPQGEKSGSEELQRLKEEHGHFLEEINAYKIEKRKLQRMLKKDVAVKSMMQSLVDQGQYETRLGTEKGVLMKISEELLSSSSQTAVRSSRVPDLYFTNTRPVSLKLVIGMLRRE